MRRLLKPLSLLLSVQACVLALGLWLQNSMLLSSVEQEDTAAARSAIDNHLDRSSRGVDRLPTVANTDALRSSMLATSLVGFLWIFGLQAVIVFLFFSRIQMEQSRKQSESEKEAVRRAHDLVRTRDAVIFGLAKLAEARDTDTGQHLERIALYSQRLADDARTLPKFQAQITPTFVRMIGISSALHDIGKVSVDDSILLKPGKLTDDERRIMQQHTIAAGDCLWQIERRLGNSNFLEMAREIALYHHERWDGGGYPTGLAGEQIPLAARIVSVADVYDALSSKRCYKDAFPHEKCVEMIRDEAGRQFDPDVVEVFLRVESQFRAISGRFADPVGETTLSTTLATDASPAHVEERQIADLSAPQQEMLLVSTVAQADQHVEDSQVPEALV